MLCCPALPCAVLCGADSPAYLAIRWSVGRTSEARPGMSWQEKRYAVGGHGDSPVPRPPWSEWRIEPARWRSELLIEKSGRKFRQALLCWQFPGSVSTGNGSPYPMGDQARSCCLEERRLERADYVLPPTKPIPVLALKANKLAVVQASAKRGGASLAQS